MAVRAARRPSARRWLRCLTSLALTAAVAACESYDLTASSGRLASLNGAGTSTSALVGRWQKTFLFVDDFGFANGTETTWTFAPDGTALRSIVTSNFTLGVSDTLFTEARYTVSGTQVVIDFVSPNTGRVVLEFRLTGSQLLLAGETYRRVGG